MPELINVPVRLDKQSYGIQIQAGLLRQLSQCFKNQGTCGHVVIVTDDRVKPLYFDLVQTQLNTVCERVDSVTIPAGEASKSIQQCESIWDQLQTFAADRSTTIIALGGGVVGDLAGFIAATYGRGIRFIQIPTTLLAQVDSSVGGKTGINLRTSKNMVGAFWQPEAVYIDPLVLNSLDQGNFSAGLAEVVKYGVIMDAPFFEFLEQNIQSINARDPEILAKTIASSCHNKAIVVEEDERETSGRRAILNYGHTFAHAIESVFGYGTYLHGHAVAIGMNCAARMAAQLKRVDADFVQRQNRLLEQLGLNIFCPTDRHDEMIVAMKRDKKVVAGKLKMVLPTEIGNVVLVDAPSDDEIKKCLSESG